MHSLPPKLLFLTFIILSYRYSYLLFRDLLLTPTPPLETTLCDLSLSYKACCALSNRRQSKYQPCRPYFGTVVSYCASKQILFQQAALLKEMYSKMKIKSSAWREKENWNTKLNADYDEIALEYWEQAKHKKIKCLSAFCLREVS